MPLTVSRWQRTGQSPRPIVPGHLNPSSMAIIDAYPLCGKIVWRLQPSGWGFRRPALAGVLGRGVVLGRRLGRQTLRCAQYRRPAEIPFPEENPYSKAKAQLGQMLFFDPILSGSKTRSCSTCHNPSLSWGDGLPRAVGEKQAAIGLRAPTLLDVAWMPRPGWDGHFRDLEEVAFGPILSPANMNLAEEILIDRLSAIPGYVDLFDAAFGEGDITPEQDRDGACDLRTHDHLGRGAFDRWVNGRRKRRQRGSQARVRPVQRQGPLRELSQRLGVH